MFGFISFFNNNGRRASAQPGGSWDAPPVEQPLETTTVHAALIEGGKVFWLMGSANDPTHILPPYLHGIWNPDGSFGPPKEFSVDLFCCGMATLPNGDVLLAGGTLKHTAHTPNATHGATYAYEVGFHQGIVGNRTDMHAGRWYPTCVTLPNGKVFVVQGYDQFGCENRLVEIYDPGPRTWTVELDPDGLEEEYCVGDCATVDFEDAEGEEDCWVGGLAPRLTLDPRLSLYPRMHLMPSPNPETPLGLIASVGAENKDWVYDPNTFKWYPNGNTIRRSYGSSVLCPLQNDETEQGKILVCGGFRTGVPAYNSAQIVEPSGTFGLTRRDVDPMKHGRRYMGPVILPTGQIVMFGGHDNVEGGEAGAVKIPEMFNPVSETWTDWEEADVPRMYHQVSLLLHDGRVWTAGTTTRREKETRVEIFKPWYISAVTRPIISVGAPTGGAYGGNITLPIPNAAAITKVSLVKISATTHHYNTDQRLIWLADPPALPFVSRTPTSVTVKAPINSKLAPPGYYLIHVLNNAGVPSVGTYIKMSG